MKEFGLSMKAGEKPKLSRLDMGRVKRAMEGRKSVRTDEKPRMPKNMLNVKMFKEPADMKVTLGEDPKQFADFGKVRGIKDRDAKKLDKKLKKELKKNIWGTSKRKLRFP
jgi:hypothetical protein